MLALAPQYAAYVTDRLADARALVRQGATTLQHVGEEGRVVVILRCPQQSAPPVNEYYAKHARLPTQQDVMEHMGALCTSTWHLEDDTGSVQLCNDGVQPPWHAVDGVVALVHVQQSARPEVYRAESFEWLCNLQLRAHCILAEEPPLPVACTVHYEPSESLATYPPCPLHVVLGHFQGDAPEGSHVIQVPELADPDAMVPYSHRALQKRPRRDVHAIPNPGSFETEDGARVWMVVPRAVMDAWRRWLPTDHRQNADIVRAMCMHRHVVPMAPQYFPVPPLTQDAFILQRVPDVVITTGELSHTEQITVDHGSMVHVITCARGASVRFPG